MIVRNWIIVFGPLDFGFWEASYFHVHNDSLSCFDNLSLQSATEDGRENRLCKEELDDVRDCENLGTSLAVSLTLDHHICNAR